MSKKQFECVINHIMESTGKSREDVMDVFLDVAFMDLIMGNNNLSSEVYRDLLHELLPSFNHLAVLLEIISRIPALDSPELFKIKGGVVSFYEGFVDLDLGDD